MKVTWSPTLLPCRKTKPSLNTSSNSPTRTSVHNRMAPRCSHWSSQRCQRSLTGVGNLLSTRPDSSRYGSTPTGIACWLLRALKHIGATLELGAKVCQHSTSRDQWTTAGLEWPVCFRKDYLTYATEIRSLWNWRPCRFVVSTPSCSVPAWVDLPHIRSIICRF